MSENDSKIVRSVIDREELFLNSISQNIWKNPELKFEEVYAHNLLTDALIKYGFEVHKNYLLQTAFRAEFSSGDGPSIAVILEYDALPGIGHACGHNLIAEAGLAAAISIKEAMENDSKIKGKVVVLGTPAEESGGGKVKLIKLGAFKNVDAAMMVHPLKADWFNPINLSRLAVSVDFRGKESHASAFPWEGINALDAAVNLYQNLGLLRQQMKPTCRLHAIITKGGTAPNIIPAESRVEIYCRAQSIKDLQVLREKVEKCIVGAAISAGCSYKANFDEDNMYYDLVTNNTMCRLFEKNLGSKSPTDPAKLGILPVGSTDMGNVSHVVPSIHPFYNIYTEASNHTEEFTNAAGAPRAQPSTLNAAKAMAMTALSLMRNPEKMAQAKEEFKIAMLIKNSS
uniref:Peptidase M20 domain-containing protein 2 n=1 Tax=Parasteatoda tepidariorum TaxID=114398 RepID=A0A2L2YFZ9_PARTP